MASLLAWLPRVAFLGLVRGVDGGAQRLEQRPEDFAQEKGAVVGPVPGLWSSVVRGRGAREQAAGNDRQAWRVAMGSGARGEAREIHGLDSGGSGLRPAVRPKPLPITGTDVTGAEPSFRLRDALAAVGLSLEAAAVALACSPSRVQAKADPGRADAPVTLVDWLRLARAGGKAREVARLLHADLGAELEDERPLPAANALPLLGLQWSVQAANINQAVADFCAAPGEQTRVAALRSIGSAGRVLGTLRAMLASQRT